MSEGFKVDTSNTDWRELYIEREVILQEEYITLQNRLSTLTLEDMSERVKITDKLSNVGLRLNNIRRRLQSDKPFTPVARLTHNDMVNLIDYILDNPTTTLDDAYLYVFEMLDVEDDKNTHFIEDGFKEWKKMVCKYTKVLHNAKTLKSRIRAHPFSKTLKSTNNIKGCIVYKPEVNFHHATLVLKKAIDRSLEVIIRERVNKDLELENIKLKTNVMALNKTIEDKLGADTLFRQNQIQAFLMYEEGCKYKDIAKALDVAEITIKRWVKKYKEYKASEK